MIKSDIIKIDNTESVTEAALKMADEFVETQGLGGKGAVRMRLLMEETLGMVRAMTGGFSADLWLEHDGSEYRIRLKAKTLMDRDKKRELIAVSKSGKNASVKGIMGKIGDMIENSMLSFDDSMRAPGEHDAYTGMTGSTDVSQDGMSILGEGLYWSLSSYRDALEREASADDEKWDELEKSIIASLAKDVIVGVKRDNIDMTVVGDF